MCASFQTLRLNLNLIQRSSVHCWLGVYPSSWPSKVLQGVLQNFKFLFCSNFTSEFCCPQHFLEGINYDQASVIGQRRLSKHARCASRSLFVERVLRYGRVRVSAKLYTGIVDPNFIAWNPNFVDLCSGKSYQALQVNVQRLPSWLWTKALFSFWESNFAGGW